MAKNKKQNNLQLLSPENYIRQKARNLPLYECLINQNWEEARTAQVVISRIHANGNLTFAMYLVDLLCMGVSDTYYQFNSTTEEYQEILDTLNHDFQMEKTPYELVHNIIFAANAFAEELGFKPHKEFTLVSQYLLEEDTDDIEWMDINCGRDGRPVYVRSEFDTDAKVAQQLKQLEKAVGKGNFDIIDTEDEEDDLEVNDEFSTLSLSEKRILFLKLVSKGLDKFTHDEQDRMTLLTDSILLDICDNDKVNDLLDSWETESNFSISDEDLTTEFMGIEPERIITKSDLKLLDDYYVSWDEARSKVPKILRALRDSWGNIPLICYYELMYLEKEKPKEYPIKLAEYSALYPDYALIKLNKYAYSVVTSKDNSEAGLLDFMDTFKGRSEITEYEMFEFQSKKMLGFIVKDNLDELEAMYSAIDELKLGDDFYGYLKSTLLITRIQMIEQYFKNN